jgi:dolichol kinase
MATALLLIVIILLSSGSRILIRHRFEKNLKPHLDALERASAKNAGLKVTTK